MLEIKQNTMIVIMWESLSPLKRLKVGTGASQAVDKEEI